MSFQTVSAILRGRWLIEKGYANANLPMAVRLLQGESVAFGEAKNKSVEPHRVIANAASAYGVSYYTDLSLLPNDSIAVLTIAGPMLKYGDICSYGMLDYAETVSRLANASNISGIITNIDSPGGQVDGTALLADAIVRAGQKKPTIGLVNDGIAASAGYWLLSANNEAYVTQPTDMVGSIGVYATIADWLAQYRDLHKLPVQEIYAPQSTDKNKDYNNALNGDDSLMKQDLKVLASEFIGAVKRNRSGKLTSDDWTTGKMYYAREAQKLGLIDGIKSFDQVIARMNQLINKN